MNKLTKSINKLNHLDIKAGLAKQKLQAFKDDLGKNIAKMGALADFNNAGLNESNEYF